MENTTWPVLRHPGQRMLYRFTGENGDNLPVGLELRAGVVSCAPARRFPDLWDSFQPPMFIVDMSDTNMSLRTVCKLFNIDKNGESHTYRAFIDTGTWRPILYIFTFPSAIGILAALSEVPSFSKVRVSVLNCDPDTVDTVEMEGFTVHDTTPVQADLDSPGDFLRLYSALLLLTEKAPPYHGMMSTRNHTYVVYHTARPVASLEDLAGAQRHECASIDLATAYKVYREIYRDGFISVTVDGVLIPAGEIQNYT